MTTADAKATQEAKELLEYLKNTAGQQIITGQHTQTIPCEGDSLHPAGHRKGAEAARL